MTAMNLNKKIFFIFSIAISSLLLVIGCKPKVKPIGENEFYVCSMDPQVMEKQPGMCPICKMPLAKTTIDKSSLHIIKLNNDQINLANIKTDTVKLSAIGKEHLLTGVFSINQNATEQISAKINGRIEQLYFKITGQQVNVGDKLYDLYSRELLLVQEEYLLTIDKTKLLNLNSQSIVTAAKNKLLLWGLNEQQIEKLEQTKQAQITNTIYSKVKGAITEIPLKEGDYVNEGTLLYKMADLSTLWVEVQLYANELYLVEQGNKVEIIPEAYPDERIEGVVVFSNPELQAQSKINLIRIEINNKYGKYKPGMQAYANLKEREKRSITLPVDAVLQEKDYTVIWVQKNKGEFEAKIVKTGIQTNDKIEIVEGVEPGDVVVTSGTYLLNSEYVFKRGTTPIGNMGH